MEGLVSWVVNKAYADKIDKRNSFRMRCEVSFGRNFFVSSRWGLFLERCGRVCLCVDLFHGLAGENPTKMLMDALSDLVSVKLC